MIHTKIQRIDHKNNRTKHYKIYKQWLQAYTQYQYQYECQSAPFFRVRAFTNFVQKSTKLKKKSEAKEKKRKERGAEHKKYCTFCHSSRWLVQMIQCRTVCMRVCVCFLFISFEHWLLDCSVVWNARARSHRMLFYEGNEIDIYCNINCYWFRSIEFLCFRHVFAGYF